MESILKSRLHRRIFSNKGREYKAYIIDDGHLHTQAKKLHAQAYLSKGFIYETDVDKAGLMKAASDPHQKHSQYFVVVEDLGDKEVVVVTGRHIHDVGKGFASFPILADAEIYDSYLEKIYSYPPENCVEISGLAKSRGTKMIATLLLYRVMWQFSLARGDRIWLMACSPALFKRLKRMFGKTITQIGPTSDYVGEEVIPAMVKIREAKTALERQTRTINPVRRMLFQEVLAFFNSSDSVSVPNIEIPDLG